MQVMIVFHRSFHYLTKWMLALNRMSLARGDRAYNSLAIQASRSLPRNQDQIHLQE